MTTEVEYDTRVIKRGETAIRRLTNKTGSRDVRDWWDVAEAWKMGRDDCIRRAGSNGPYGESYRHLISDWLARHPKFADDHLPSSTRANLVEMQENRLEIQAWYTTLPLKVRVRTNSPSAILRRWRQSKSPAFPPSRPARPEVSDTTRNDHLALQRDKIDTQRAEIAQLQIEKARRAEVDLCSDSAETILAFIRRGGIDAHKAKVLRDGLITMFPLPLPKLVPVTQDEDQTPTG
jgi:hypothetical protein